MTRRPVAASEPPAASKPAPVGRDARVSLAEASDAPDGRTGEMRESLITALG